MLSDFLLVIDRHSAVLTRCVPTELSTSSEALTAERTRPLTLLSGRRGRALSFEAVALASSFFSPAFYVSLFSDFGDIRSIIEARCGTSCSRAVKGMHTLDILTRGRCLTEDCSTSYLQPMSVRTNRVL